MKNILCNIYSFLYSFFFNLSHISLYNYYRFAKKHRKNHRGGCVPYTSYIKLFQIVKNYKNSQFKKYKKYQPEDIKILEIGTATGFTSFVMNCACKNKCRIDTIEKNIEHIAIANEKFKNFNLNNITILEGRAEDILMKIITENKTEKYNIIFFDAFAPKQEHAINFEMILKKNGILISANSFLKKADEKYFDNFKNQQKWVMIEEFDDTKIWKKVC